MVTLLHYRLKVTLNDGRQLVGQMLAYDKHMNFVLAECEEFRTVKVSRSRARRKSACWQNKRREGEARGGRTRMSGRVGGARMRTSGRGGGARMGMGCRREARACWAKERMCG